MTKDSSLRTKSIEIFIIQQKLIATGGTVIATALTIMLIGILVKTFPKISARIGGDLPFFSYPDTYFTIGIIVLVLGLFFAMVFSIYVGYFTGRRMKGWLQRIEDANEAISRGKLNFRLELEDCIEFDRVSFQFNLMADRVQQQVESLQRLVSENKKLIEGAGHAASIEERRKIARELHDAVSQQLFAISITAAALPKLMDTRPQEAKEYFKKIEEMVRLAQQELRALIMHLRPVTLEGDCLSGGIIKLLEELKQKYTDIRFEWEIEDIKSLEAGIEDNIFRVIQESISNTIRHAKATVLSLRLIYRNKRIILFIEDNGVGFDIGKDKKSSYGISTMKERVNELGGSMDILSYPNKGTRIEIRIPIELG